MVTKGQQKEILATNCLLEPYDMSFMYPGSHPGGSKLAVSVRSSYVIGRNTPRSPDAGGTQMLNFGTSGQRDSNLDPYWDGNSLKTTGPFTKLGTSMASQEPQHFHPPFHFVLFPFMAQGYTIPMVDIARLKVPGLEQCTINIVTMPHNAWRFRNAI
ncbi:hypothetical protein YC2023_084609 [Brassica napus]